MHRSTLPPAAAGHRPKQLVHHLLDRQALGKGVTVAAKRGGDPVLLLQCKADAHGRRLLALALVDRPGHGSLQEEEFNAIFKFADQNHPLVHG